jgi:hypothetical protein
VVLNCSVLKPVVRIRVEKFVPQIVIVVMTSDAFVMNRTVYVAMAVDSMTRSVVLKDKSVTP